MGDLPKEKQQAKKNRAVMNRPVFFVPDAALYMR
ncbi:hypothetical protein CBM2585_A160297 [Cupriavidus taiwanensis]|nr:hypothetical protein CBM2585_A160297 [Cupriavidus taiwanensis]